jgi:hypothetical protein
MLNLSAEERLYALRSLDVFHPWESVDEKRLCRRCGNIITGRQVKIRRHGWGGKPTRLGCPTEGCLGVPLEWIILESPVPWGPAPQPPFQSGTFLVSDGADDFRLPVDVQDAAVGQ